MGPSTDSPALRVLIVEDDLIMAECLARFLRSWGNEVTVTSNGPDALGVAPSFQPEVVLLDIGLPVMDGYEVARRLRRLPGMEKCLLMALTGQGCEADLHCHKEAGLDFHFLKPVEPALLREVLSSAGKFRKQSEQLIS